MRVLFSLSKTPLPPLLPHAPPPQMRATRALLWSHVIKQETPPFLYTGSSYRRVRSCQPARTPRARAPRHDPAVAPRWINSHVTAAPCLQKPHSSQPPRLSLSPALRSWGAWLRARAGSERTPGGCMRAEPRSTAKARAWTLERLEDAALVRRGPADGRALPGESSQLCARTGGRRRVGARSHRREGTDRPACTGLCRSS